MHCQSTSGYWKKQNSTSAQKTKKLLRMESFCGAMDQIFQSLGIVKAWEGKALDNILELDDKDRCPPCQQSQYQPVPASKIQPVKTLKTWINLNPSKENQKPMSSLLKQLYLKLIVRESLIK